MPELRLWSPKPLARPESGRSARSSRIRCTTRRRFRAGAMPARHEQRMKPVMVPVVQQDIPAFAAFGAFAPGVAAFGAGSASVVPRLHRFVRLDSIQSRTQATDAEAAFASRAFSMPNGDSAVSLRYRMLALADGSTRRRLDSAGYGAYEARRHIGRLQVGFPGSWSLLAWQLLAVQAAAKNWEYRDTRRPRRRTPRAPPFRLSPPDRYRKCCRSLIEAPGIVERPRRIPLSPRRGRGKGLMTTISPSAFA